MMYLVCALYGEAEPWIRYFSLKKQTEFHRLQVFANEQVTCVITGVGPMAAATALTEVLTVREAQGALTATDVLVNIGVCGCQDSAVPVGTVYLCHSIQDGTTGRVYYPDILYKHSFLEGSLYSSTKALTQEELQTQSCQLVDMEGAAVYQSAIRFFKTHQLFFIKIVSDYGVPDTKNAIEVPALMENAKTQTAPWLQGWIQQPVAESVFTKEQEEALDALCKLLKASVTMEMEIHQLMIWCKLSGQDGVALFYAFLQEQGVTEIKSKREGAALLAKFKQQLF